MFRLSMLATVSMLTLSACGGGGVNSTPAPVAPPPPPPPPTSPVTIFAEPVSGAYDSVGAWTNVGEWDSQYYPTPSDGNARIAWISSADANQPRIRYTASGYYEVLLPGESFDRLIHHRHLADPSADNTLFEASDQPSRIFQISGSRNSGYQYSEMMSWWRPDLDFASTADFGFVAFGVPTPAGSVPVTGSASYQGLVIGMTDAKGIIANTDNFYLLSVEGTVNLAFDFGSGALGGDMRLFLNEGMSPLDLGTFEFNQTLFGRGSTTYSGNFATTLQGFNFFNGKFTGPNAEETIGAWAVPFSYDGNTHQALGAWIARRGN